VSSNISRENSVKETDYNKNMNLIDNLCELDELDEIDNIEENDDLNHSDDTENEYEDKISIDYLNKEVNDHIIKNKNHDYNIEVKVDKIYKKVSRRISIAKELKDKKCHLECDEKFIAKK